MDCLRDGFEQDKLLDGRFLTLSPLNHGSFGMVFIAKDTLTGQDVAIKCITKPGAQEAVANCPAALATDDRSEELAIHSKLPEHEHIVNLIHDFETENHQYMVLELCGNGDLYEAIRLGHGPLETEHVRDFMLQLVDAVQHLHDNGVYHRDIKPENIFLTTARSLKLGDFGLATTETWSTEFAVGSDRYMAPEQFDASVYGYGYSPAAADVWAIGIVLLNVLFQRNPFATPTHHDPLFADFAHDRQSLFDVFPTMSQDTYNVVRYSLALDPANRSLGAVREALKSVVSFTTLDESLDDFAVERLDLVPVSTAAREPLRTPSITSPVTNQDDFPWSTVLATPQKPINRLPTIPDDESELFPGSVQSGWHYVDADEASLSSNLDSGLGMSFKSTKSTKSLAPKPNNFVGSLPITFTRPGKALSPYGSNTFSKSWSDLWDEDNEPEGELPAFDASELGIDISRVSTAKPARSVRDDDRGSMTPRLAKAEVDQSGMSSGTATPLADRTAELVKVKSSSILDKWSALGNFRRAKIAPPVDSAPVTPAKAPVQAAETPAKTKYADAWASFSPFKKQESSPFTQRTPARSVARAVPSRSRVQSANGKSWERRDLSPKHPAVPAVAEPWTLDNNWRDHKPRTLMLTNSPPQILGTSPRTPGSLHGKSTKPSTNASFNDDIGDLEWVGGWKDFHV